MKTLANCKPSEFLIQTNKIRKSVFNWLTVTDVLNIRKRTPIMDSSISEEEKKRRISDQIKKNLNDMLDSILDNHPMETIELLALLCFIDPKEADDHPMSDYLGAIAEMIADEAVMSFFVSLVKLDQRTTSPAQEESN